VVNEQHAHAGYAVYDPNATGSYATDPLFGSLPGAPEADYSGQYDTTQWNGTAEQTTSGYDTYGSYGTYASYETYAPYDATQFHTGQYPAEQYGTGQYGTGQYHAEQYQTAHQFPQPHPHPQDQPQAQAQAQSEWSDPNQTVHQQAHPVGYEPTAVFDATQFQDAPAAYEPTMHWTVPSYDAPTGTGAVTVPGAGTAAETGDGAYDAAWYASQETLVAQLVVPEELGSRGHEPEPEHHFDATAAYDQVPEQAHEQPREQAPEQAHEPESVHLAETMAAPVVTPKDLPARPVGGGSANRGRRRPPAKRSALLTIAVPSACVMGVAGIAAASVGGLGGGDDPQDDKNTAAAADPAQVKPVAANNKVDTQLAALSADARDFGDRASRTQERMDLKARQEADKKKRDEEAARKEAARPKYLLPVKQRGLSAYFGQAGVNWMSVHTGIDFPVMTGTPVSSVTDGTVRTQWNSSYGNMAIVTAPDGTETWYCHLSSTKVRSGSVKAGDVIALDRPAAVAAQPRPRPDVGPRWS
jgi:murein DD-endopeptidase MepM/ murein hydrolase activator NlpD